MASATEVVTRSSSPPIEVIGTRKTCLILPSSPNTSPYFTKPDPYEKGKSLLKSGSRAERIPDGVHTGFRTAKDLSTIRNLSRFAFESHDPSEDKCEYSIGNLPQEEKLAPSNIIGKRQRKRHRPGSRPQEVRQAIKIPSDHEKTLNELREIYRAPKTPDLLRVEQVGHEGDQSHTLLDVIKKPMETVDVSDSSINQASPVSFIGTRQRPNFISCIDTNFPTPPHDKTEDQSDKAPGTAKLTPPISGPSSYPLSTHLIDLTTTCSPEHAVETLDGVLGDDSSKCRKMSQGGEPLNVGGSRVEVPKKKAKSSRTVTDIALAAFRDQATYDTLQSNPPSIPLLVGDNDHNLEIIKANVIKPPAAEIPTDVPKNTSAKKRRCKGSRSNPPKKKKEGNGKKEKALLPKLPAPDVALHTLKEQKWLFGTSSQLAQENGIRRLTSFGTSVENAYRNELEVPHSLKLWDVATHAGDDLAYVGEPPLPKSIAETSFYTTNADQQGVPTVRSIHASIASSPVKLSATRFFRAKPTLLCASALPHGPSAGRKPLVTIPINVRGVHAFAADETSKSQSFCENSLTPGSATVTTTETSTQINVKGVNNTLATKNHSQGVVQKKPRGCSSKKSPGKDAPKAGVQKPRGRSTMPRAKEKSSKSKKAKKSEDGFEEIDDSEANTTPSPPRQKSERAGKKLKTEQPESEAKARQKRQRTAGSGGDEDRLAELRVSLFPKLTAAIKNSSPTLDPQIPSWHEKILLYDPIVVEDITAWFNDGRLGDLEQPVSPSDVQRWCDDNSICCIWRDSGWRRAKGRN